MLSPEDKLILSSVKIQPGVAELEQMNDLIPQIKDWDYVVKTSIDRGIGPLLSKKLPLLPNNPQIPAHVKTKLQQAYYKTFSRSALLYEYFKKVAEALALHNIEVIALKGIYLSEWLYEDIGLRQFSDIDLLVREEDGPRCLDILAGMGFTPESDIESEFERKLEVVHFTPMVLNGVSIEIHVKLHRNNEKYHVNVNELWRNALPVIINNTSVYALNTNDLIIHLCTHLDKHFYQGHVQFTCFNDITNLLDIQATKIDWDALITACKHCNCENVIFKWFMLVNRYMNAPLPTHIIEKYSALLTAKDEQLFYKYLNGYVGFTSGLPKHMGNFEYLDSFPDQVRYFWEILFPSKNFMMAKFNIKHPGLVLFYYPYRYWLGVKGIVKIVMR